MSNRVEILVATINQKDLSIVDEMCIKSPVFIANQSDVNDYCEIINKDKKIRMISTNTKGVGINRNLGLLFSDEDILLFSDDDMVYYEGYEQLIIDAFNELQDADVIIFNFDLIKDNEEKKSLITKTRRVGYHNALCYGTCSIAVKRKIVQKYNLHFSTLFGGGCIYGSGEDSLFIMDCLKARIKVYTHKSLIGKNICNQSSWFNGFNEKYFYDKGAWISCAFPKLKNIIKFYFVFRFNKKMTDINPKKRLFLINAGIKGFNTLKSFEQWKNEVE